MAEASEGGLICFIRVSVKVSCVEGLDCWSSATKKEVIYLVGILRRFQHCTGNIKTGSWKGKENHYIQLVKVWYCKLSTNGKQLPAFPLEVEP